MEQRLTAFRIPDDARRVRLALALAPDGRVVYGLRRHWRDGTSAISFDPLAFIERLAALVPRPHCHLVTYHGVLAPAAQWRDLIVPAVPSSPEKSPKIRSASRRSTWAELLQRVFAIDVLTCPYCGAKRKLIALITDGVVVRKILSLAVAPLGYVGGNRRDVDYPSTAATSSTPSAVGLLTRSLT